MNSLFSVNSLFYSFIFKVHLHRIKYFLLAKEKFQEISIFGKRSERKKIISNVKISPIKRPLKPHDIFLSKKNNLTFLGFEMITMNKT